MTTTTDIKKYKPGKGENKESPSTERNVLVQVEASWEFRALLTGRRRRRRKVGRGEGRGRGGQKKEAEQGPEEASVKSSPPFRSIKGGSLEVGAGCEARF